MSNDTQKQKGARLAQYIGIEELSSGGFVDPYTGEIVDSCYDSMPFAWAVHVKFVRENEAYRQWWIVHCLNSPENPHWDWLDKIYALLTKRPILLVNKQWVPYRGALVVQDEGMQTRVAYENTMGDDELLLVSMENVYSYVRPSTGREVICVTTEGIEA